MSDGIGVINKYYEMENQTQILKIGYIMQTPEEDWYRSLENSHFNSCMQNQYDK
jgi:hypothetical protein